MPISRKQKPRRKPFVVTFAQAATTMALLPGCFSTVTSNPPYVEEPGCPDQEPAAGAACSGSLSCEFLDPTGCTKLYFCETGQWQMTSGCNPPPCTPEDPCEPPPECPVQAPTWGEPCSGMVSCSYEIDVGCGPQPATATCDGATWSVQPSISCNPPAPADCPTLPTEEQCSAFPNCRWLVPGCGMPALPQAGCFEATDCLDASCLAGETCQEVVINPCHNQLCDACGGLVSVCLPPATP